MRAALLAVALALAAAAPAEAAPTLVKLGDFAQPVHVASPPRDPRVFVVEKAGLVRIIGGGTFLDVRTRTQLAGLEQGLLSIAFAPDYAASGRFYVFLTARPDGRLQVLEFRRSAADPNRAYPASARVILEIAHPVATNHNGGQLQFGPDGALYVSTGDGGTGGANAQNLSSMLGKILRIDGSGAHVWSYGLRNPWRFTFDRATGDLVIGDVGEATWEEVDWAPAAGGRGAGVNWGWPGAEGPAGVGGTRPAFSRNHADGYHAIVGGYVVRDPGLPTLVGRYLYGDAALGSLRSTTLVGDADRAEPLPIASLSSFGEDACGRIYVSSLNGPVYRVQDGAPTPCRYPPPRAPAPRPPAADTTPPRLRVAIRGLRHRRLRLALRCDEACRTTIAVRLFGVRRLSIRHRTLAAARRTVVRLKLSPRTLRRLRHRLAKRGLVRVRVTVTAADAAGNVRRVTRRGRLVPGNRNGRVVSHHTAAS
jgi:hypothetical protein